MGATDPRGEATGPGPGSRQCVETVKDVLRRLAEGARDSLGELAPPKLRMHVEEVLAASWRAIGACVPGGGPGLVDGAGVELARERVLSLVGSPEAADRYIAAMSGQCEPNWWVAELTASDAMIRRAVARVAGTDRAREGIVEAIRRAVPNAAIHDGEGWDLPRGDDDDD